jgi:hypothetical protein
MPVNYQHLHLKLAIRKAMLKQRNFSMGRGSLLNRFPTMSLENFDAVIAECKSEGLIVESVGVRETVLYTWCENAVEVTR